MNYWMGIRTMAINELCWKSRTKATGRFVLAAGCPAASGKYNSAQLNCTHRRCF